MREYEYKNDYFSIFPTRLRELMEKEKVTNLFLGESCGMRYQKVSKLRLGEQEPKLSDLHKLAEFFDVSIAYLVGEEK